MQGFGIEQLLAQLPTNLQGSFGGQNSNPGIGQGSDPGSGLPGTGQYNDQAQGMAQESMRGNPRTASSFLGSGPAGSSRFASGGYGSYPGGSGMPGSYGGFSNPWSGYRTGPGGAGGYQRFGQGFGRRNPFQSQYGGGYGGGYQQFGPNSMGPMHPDERQPFQGLGGIYGNLTSQLYDQQRAQPGSQHNPNPYAQPPPPQPWRGAGPMMMY